MKITIPSFKMEIPDDEFSLDLERRKTDVKEQIKWAIQRAVNGYDERVSWSIDYHLNKYMPLWIAELKNGKGTPISFFPDDYINLSNDEKEAVDKKAYEDFQIVLDKIAEGFISANIIADEWVVETPDNIHWKKFNEGFDLFKKYYFNLWW